MNIPYLDTVIYDSFYELMHDRYEKSGGKVAIRYFAGEEIKEITYRELIREVACTYFFLKEKGLLGKHIAILSENRYEYIVIWLATVLDGVIVPLDKELDPETIADCLERFDADALFCTKKTGKKLQDIGIPADTVFDLDVIYEKIRTRECEMEEFFRLTKGTDRDRFAVLACTSGTDGKMKGVMLSQYNVITNIRGTLENNVLESPTLAFLPMNHTYGFHPCILATLYNGTTLCLNLELKYLMRDLKAFDPFFFGAVPMVISGMYENIMREVRRQKKEGSFRRLIAFSRFLLRFGIDLRHLFFGKIINPRLRLVVNGGAPLNADLVGAFGDLGITILNGYGLTECSPTVAVSRTVDNVAGSAGTIMKHIEVKTAEDGELLVKGPCVMMGYYGDEEATKRCLHDGWLSTGDIGYTKDKLIFVTGRKKNLIILENGKNVAPEYLEDRISRLPYVKESLVVPERAAGRIRILKALVVLQDGEDGAGLESDLQQINASLPEYMRISDHEILSREFEKNSSGKIIRSRYIENDI